MGGVSIFDGITPDDLVMAFFPCIRFCNIAEYNQRLAQEKWRRDGMPVERIWHHLKTYAEERQRFYMLCLKMHATIEIRNCRMVMENPWGELNYTNYFWFMRPSVIDKDRTRRGDYFKKPTAFWFLNCSPTYGTSIQQTPSDKIRSVDIGCWSKKPNKHKKEDRAKGSSVAGLCSEERSMISPDYARNFICDFIIGREQPEIDKQMKLF